MYKISYHHCNKCLYQSLWNIAIKDIKKHSPHKMTWMEKVSKQCIILHSSHSTVHWIPLAVQWGSLGVRQQTLHPQLSMLHLSSPSAGPTSSGVILVTVSGDFSALLWLQTSFMHNLWTCSKYKKEQQYIFLFNIFL